MEDIWCTYIGDMGHCGRLKTHGDRCKYHIGEEIKEVRIKTPKFRGDSQWQLDNGMGTNKTGSNV